MSSLTGPGMIPAHQLQTSGATQYHVLGEKFVTPDGRSYRYVKAGGTALVAGNVLQSQAQDTDSQNLAVAAASVGATTVTTTDTLTVTANEFAGGYLLVTEAAGEGYIYRVKSHPAATTAVLTITLEDSLVEALTTSNRIDLVANPYDAVIVAPTTQSGVVVGVAIRDIAADQYGWIQTGGVACVLCDGTITVGDPVVFSDNVAGAVEVIADGASELLPRVGIAVTAVTDTEHGAILLQLE